VNVHDNEIISYEVDLKNHKITLHTIQNNCPSITSVEFGNVLAHLFETQLEGSIILDIKEYDLDQFFKDNHKLLIRQKSYAWPVVFDSLEELSNKLHREKYRYYIISSSYGLNGWILAKHISICDRSHSDKL